MKVTWYDMGTPAEAEGRQLRADEPSPVGQTLMLENNAGIIVAKLYVQKDGNLHPDSWIKTGYVI